MRVLDCDEPLDWASGSFWLVVDPLAISSLVVSMLAVVPLLTMLPLRLFLLIMLRKLDWLGACWLGALRLAWLAEIEALGGVGSDWVRAPVVDIWRGVFQLFLVSRTLCYVGSLLNIENNRWISNNYIWEFLNVIVIVNYFKTSNWTSLVMFEVWPSDNDKNCWILYLYLLIRLHQW